MMSLILVALATVALGEDAPVKHRILIVEYGHAQNRFAEVDTDGKILWQFKPPSIAVIFQALPNGNIVYAYGGNPTGVTEVNRKGETVWNYVSKCPQVLGCERLENGNTLVGEQGPCQAVEVDPKGNVVHTTKLTTAEQHFHRQVRNVHKLKDGHILAAHEGDGTIREYDADGKVVWEYKGVENTGEALRLENGNTLIAGATTKRIFEVTPDGKTVWEFKAADAPELNMTWISSLQILKNGNIVACNFLRGQEGKGVHAFEVTREKKVVWTFADHQEFKSLTSVRVEEDGK
jgi:outer membrane protein assembly factor BamB